MLTQPRLFTLQKTIYSMVERPPTALATPIPNTGVEPRPTDVPVGLGAPGDTLETFINEGRCTPTAAYFVLVQLLEALKKLHERGIAHLDIRPATILMWTMIVVTASDGTEVPVPLIKLAEWGRWLPRPPVNALTMDYVGPELFHHAAVGDSKADIFAAGMVFYRMYIDKELRATPPTFHFTTASGIHPTATGFPARFEQQSHFRDASRALTPEGKLLFAMTSAAPESRSTAAFVLDRYFTIG
jgi:serine/threonine protein kinase